jgi:hypothetical protein
MRNFASKSKSEKPKNYYCHPKRRGIKEGKDRDPEGGGGDLGRPRKPGSLVFYKKSSKIKNRIFRNVG